MHELALADAVIHAALEAAERESLARITRIEVHVGELQGIRRESFEFALAEVVPVAEPRFAATHIQLAIEPARFRCRSCHERFSLNSQTAPGSADAAEAIHFIPELAHAFLRCPGCASPDFEVVAGRGVSIEAIEGE